MTRCIQCLDSTKPPKLIHLGYCEICGFGFLMDGDHYSNVTCRSGFATYQLAVEAGFIKDPTRGKGTKVRAAKSVAVTPVPPVMVTVPIAGAPVASTSVPITDAPVASTSVPITGAPVAVPIPPSENGTQRVLDAIRDHGLIGKARIIELSSVSEIVYTLAIRALLAGGRIVQEGERRGAKYRVKEALCRS
jgi:hypothetical protein